jgi:hypothetical protein
MMFQEELAEIYLDELLSEGIVRNKLGQGSL